MIKAKKKRLLLELISTWSLVSLFGGLGVFYLQMINSNELGIWEHGLHDQVTVQNLETAWYDARTALRQSRSADEVESQNARVAFGEAVLRIETGNKALRFTLANEENKIKYDKLDAAWDAWYRQAANSITQGLPGKTGLGKSVGLNPDLEDLRDAMDKAISDIENSILSSIWEDHSLNTDVSMNLTYLFWACLIVAALITLFFVSRFLKLMKDFERSDFKYSMDIADRMQAEHELLEANRKLEEAVATSKRYAELAELANVAKGEFLATMSMKSAPP